MQGLRSRSSRGVAQRFLGAIAAVLLLPAHAEIAPAHETDTYKVPLTAGSTYDLRLMPFCGEGIDAQIVLLDPTGTVPIARSAGHSATGEILGLKILQSGAYRVQVKAFGAAIGEYRLAIEASDG